MSRRPGITLVEVLVAILIMGVGLLALLTLFPLGALEMAQAIKADRAGHAKHNAIALASVAWPDSTGGPTPVTLRTDPDVKNGMLDPNGTVTTTAYPPGTLPSFYQAGLPGTINPNFSNVPSYPVLVDPNGFWANRNTAWQDWVAGGPANPNGFVLPRRVCCEPLKPGSQGGQVATSAAIRRQQLLQWTSLLDDMTFPRDVDYAGRPCLPVGLVDRAPRYSWSYLCRMPKAVSNGPVYVTVIVYNGRALEQATSGETAFSAVYNSGTNVVTLNWNPGQDPPDVTVGGWIFDATMKPDPHGYFYRIVSINQTSATSMDVEVQTPLLGTGSGVAVIMDGVIEVFDMRTF